MFSDLTVNAIPFYLWVACWKFIYDFNTYNKLSEQPSPQTNFETSLQQISNYSLIDIPTNKQTAQSKLHENS